MSDFSKEELEKSKRIFNSYHPIYDGVFNYWMRSKEKNYPDAGIQDRRYENGKGYRG